MKDLIKAMDDLPLLVKVILALPALDIIWGIYRVIKGATNNNLLTLVVGILWIVPGSVFCWIVDMLTLILTKSLLFAD